MNYASTNLTNYDYVHIKSLHSNCYDYVLRISEFPDLFGNVFWSVIDSPYLIFQLGIYFTKSNNIQIKQFNQFLLQCRKNIRGHSLICSQKNCHMRHFVSTPLSLFSRKSWRFLWKFFTLFSVHNMQIDSCFAFLLLASIIVQLEISKMIIFWKCAEFSLHTPTAELQ